MHHLLLLSWIIMSNLCYRSFSFSYGYFSHARKTCSRWLSSSGFVNHKPHFPAVTTMQWKQLDHLSECLTEWNQKVNLVSRKDIEELIPNHIVPSMTVSLCRSFCPGESVIDIGTGGGLPGLPLAIIHSDVTFTLLDSSTKKMMVVADLVRSLNLKNVRVVTSRAEEFQGRFDVLLGRSVTALPNFLSWSAHLLKKDADKNSGLFYIKGGDFVDELTYAGIKQYTKHPICDLVKSLPNSDKCVLYIPTDQIVTFHNRK